MLETWESLPAENCKSAACCFSILTGLYSAFYHFKEIKVACAILKADKVDVFWHVVSLVWKNEVDLLLVLYGSEFWVFIFRFCKHNALCNMNCFQAEFSQDHVNDSKFDFWGFVVANWKSNCWYISKLRFAHSEYNSKKLDAHAAGHPVLLWNL